MTTNQQNLSSRENELVAVGASVGAGCHPCVTHHIEAGAKAGLDGEQLLAAVTSAERVTAEAAVAIGDHARATLGTDVTSLALLSRLEEALASLGAALGANDLTNIERQLKAAADLGASRPQLQQAIETAHTVQENAARIHVGEAERLLESIAPANATRTTGVKSDDGCGCGADTESKKTPSESEAPEPAVAATGTEPRNGCGDDADDKSETAQETEAPEPVVGVSGKSADCHSMAALFGADSASGAMSECRPMFERFMGASPPAETKAPAATVAADPCNKEA